MKTAPTERIDLVPKLSRNNLRIGCFVILLGLPFLFYFGYCWGLWGRGSLLLQYLFQCGCPVSSDEMRYPERVDVVVPACRHNGVVLSPSGRLLYVHVGKFPFASDYLLDLQTGKKTPFSVSERSSEGSIYFLNDTLIFYTFSIVDEYLIDLETGRQYPIPKFRDSRSGIYANREEYLNALAEGLRESEYVFLIDNDIVVALASDFRAFPKHNFFTGWFDFPGYNDDRVEKFLQEQEIAYIHIPDYPEYLAEALSLDDNFIARNDGIYLAETVQKIVNGYPGVELFGPDNGKYFSFQGWVYDSSGAIYSDTFNPCLIQLGFPFADGPPICYFEVPQPVLKLKVPQEYLSSLPAYPNPNRSE